MEKIAKSEEIVRGRDSVKGREMEKREKLNSFTILGLRGKTIAFSSILSTTIILFLVVVLTGQLWSQGHLRLREEQAKEHFRRGLNFFNDYQYTAAREFFYKALNIQPHFHLSRRYLGDAYYYSGDWDSALGQWEFLDKIAKGAYPLVSQRSDLLRRSITAPRRYQDYIYLRHYEGGRRSEYKMQRPVDLAIGAEGNLYVASFASANLIKIGPLGDLHWENNGPFYDTLERPLAMAIDSRDYIYLCDYRDDRVRVFDNSGREVFSFGGRGSAVGKFHGPAGIAVGQDAIFVADAGNRRIQKFDKQGKYQSIITTTAEPLLHPTGLAIDPQTKQLYVADRDGGRILLYEPGGQFITEIGSGTLKQPRSLQIDGESLLVADEKAGILFYNMTDQTWRPLGKLRNEQDKIVKLVRPFAARFGPFGRLYIADYGSNRIVVTVLRGMRISNLDTRIQRVDSRSFPHMILFVSLKDHAGNPVTNLPAHSFLLYENGRPIANLSSDGMTPYNRRQRIIIAKENSPLFRRDLDSLLQKSLAALLAPLRQADKLIVLRIGSNVQTVYEGLERRRILRYLSEGSVAAEPNLSKGLYSGIALLSRELGPRSINLIVSGHYYERAFSQYSLKRIIQYAKANGIIVNVISYESDNNDKRRRQAIETYSKLAKNTGGAYLRAFDEKELAELYDFSYTRKDGRYLLTYQTILEKSLSDHYVDLQIRIRYSGTYGVADAGYFIPR